MTKASHQKTKAKNSGEFDLKGGLFTIGAAYYPDYLEPHNRVYDSSDVTVFETPKDRMRRDLDRMLNLGMKLIRIGEFSWSSVEPEPGVFKPDIFDYTLDQAGERGIDVIFCTPTATPPKWLTDKFPEILIVTREGKKIPFGGRRHYDPLSLRYQEESRRITTKYATHFGRHRAVVGWQVDNEFGHHTSSRSFSSDCIQAFRTWLKNRYETIAVLNNCYFSSFWSMGYRDFFEVDPPFACLNPPNPHLELDFYRFMTHSYKAFQAQQIEIIKKLCPQSWVTHNLIPNFDELCLWQMTEDLDFVGYDHYQTKSRPDPLNSAVQLNLMRSLKDGKSFLVLEQQPLQVNWQSHNRRFSPDWLFLWGLQSFLSGACAQLYFSWQRFYGGGEQYHDGVRSHDVRVAKTATEKMIECQGAFFAKLKQTFNINDGITFPFSVVVVLNFESSWTHTILPQTDQFVFWELLKDWLTPLFRLGIGLRFVPDLKEAERVIADQSQIGLKVTSLFLPSYAFEFQDGERRFLRSFMDQGGHIVSMPRTAIKTKTNGMSSLPLWIFEPNDFSILDHGPVSEDDGEQIELDSAILGDFGPFDVRVWAEKIKLPEKQGGAFRALGYFTRGLYKGAPALIEKRTESGGSYTHFAFIPKLHEGVDRLLLKCLGLHCPKSLSGQSQVLTTRWLDGDGRAGVAALNFDAHEGTLHLSPEEAQGRFLLAAINSDETLKMNEILGLSASSLVQGQTVTEGKLETLEIRIPARHVLIGCSS